ncbi:MAG: hypothetical protein GY896_22945 [Gammaproteobacteria bacterium]|nr:hypothetical protein [Gammaproteobacteria bacterium]
MGSLLIEDWSYDSKPQDIPRDEVRELVGDTDKNRKLVSDTTIDLALESQNNNTRLAAAKVAEKIAARFMKDAISKSGKDYSRTIAIAESYQNLGERLIKQSSNAVGSAAQTRVSSSQALYGNGDIRRGAFRTGMFNTPEFDPRTELRDQDLLDDVRNEES